MNDEILKIGNDLQKEIVILRSMVITLQKPEVRIQIIGGEHYLMKENDASESLNKIRVVMLKFYEEKLKKLNREYKDLKE